MHAWPSEMVNVGDKRTLALPDDCRGLPKKPRRSADDVSTEKRGGKTNAQRELSLVPFSRSKACLICRVLPCDRITTCAHGFCTPCLNEWRKQASTCPLCRTELDPGKSSRNLLRILGGHGPLHYL